MSRAYGSLAAGAKAPKVLYRPPLKYLARGWSTLWSRKFESLPARPASPGSATIGPGQMSCGARGLTIACLRARRLYNTEQKHAQRIKLLPCNV